MIKQQCQVFLIKAVIFPALLSPLGYDICIWPLDLICYLSIIIYNILEIWNYENAVFKR